MQWTAPATGIAMCQSAAALEQQRESAYGYKRTLALTSPFDPKQTLGPVAQYALFSPLNFKGGEDDASVAIYRN